MLVHMLKKLQLTLKATVAQLTAINNALNRSNLNAAALEYPAIDAKKALAEGQTIQLY